MSTKIDDIKKWTEDGFELKAERHYDSFTDLSWIGKFEARDDLKGEGYGNPIKVDPVRTRSGFLCSKRDPLTGEIDYTTYFYPHKGVEEHAEEDAERLRAYYLEEWEMVGVVVRVSRNGIELASDSLWGIECGGKYGFGDSGIERIAVEQVAPGAMARAREALSDLCASVA